jgi:stringent starvation protein B
MAIPIPDLRLDDDGMRCTLSFGGSPFFCVVPWNVVFAIVGGDARGMVWPDDVPVEVSRQPSPPRAVEAPVPSRPAEDSKTDLSTKSKKPRKRAPLAAVADEEPAAPPSKPKPAVAAAPQPAPPAPSSPAVPAPAPSRPAVGAPRKKRELPPYLRVVK